MKNKFTLAKILGFFFLNTFVFLSTGPLYMTIILALMILSCLPANPILIKRLKIIIPIALFVMLFQIIFNTSQPFLDRVILGYVASIRIIIISLSVLLFLTITSISEIMLLFDFLPRKILLTFMMTCYFIPGVLNEAEKIKAVQKSRGLKTSRWIVTSNIASIIVPLLHRVFQRAETLSMAILSRGFEE